MKPPIGDQSRPRHPISWGLIALVSAAMVLIAHGASLQNGLWLDDQAHFQNLRRLDWSFSSAVESSRLGIVGDVMGLWGRRQESLWFFRPIAFWTMKAQYALVGWQAMPMHAFSLLWHFVCAMLVAALAARVLGGRVWGLLAAIATAAHPGHCITVNWVACQTELMATAYLLAGVVLYARHAGWQRAILGTQRSLDERPDQATREPPPRVTLAGMLSIVCYALALGCRENTILFPLVCWLGDRLLGTRRRSWLRWEHIAMGAVLAGYFGLRSATMGGFTLPNSVYFKSPSEPDFVVYLAKKTIYYLVGLFYFVPVLPNGLHDFVDALPRIARGGFTLGVIALLLTWRAFGWTRALIWPLVWFTLLIAPVLPVFPCGHHLYLPGPGIVIVMIAGLAAIAGAHRPAAGPRSGFRIGLASSLCALYVLAMVAISIKCGSLYRTVPDRENRFVDQILHHGTEVREGDRFFFVNLAYPCYYAVVAAENRTGLRDLHGMALTFSTDSFDAGPPVEVTAMDRHRLRLRATGNELFLSGIAGKVLLQMMGFDRMPQEGVGIDSGEFTVTPTSASDKGVREMIFAFREPLDSPRYHFFVGSREQITAPLDVKYLLLGIERQTATATTPP